ncbi:MAG: tetraacyldisaccharide 4'-kinase [Bacteroidota bacterium]
MPILKYLLLPFSLLYGLITWVRNKCYDFGVFKTYEIPVKSILVGNLSMGGTGKTPHTAYLAEMLCNEYQTVILSRGYRRQSKGFLWIDDSDEVLNAGDEPLFYAKEFDNRLKVAVCESRAVGVRQILKDEKKTKLILLDDAFQHRAVRAGYSILLTDFSRPFDRDFVLPAGNLREFSFGKNRADCLIVTKCPTNLSPQVKMEIKKRLNFKNENVFFSTIKYGELRCFGKKIEAAKKVLIITGIANPTPLIDFYKDQYQVESIQFADHHLFTSEEIDQIHSKFDIFADENSIIVTTEKDYVRLEQLLSKEQREKYPWYYQTIAVKIDEEEKFNQIIKRYVDAV